MNRRSADQDKMSRGLQLGVALIRGQPITSEFIRRKFGVSRPTAKRDMLMVETVLAPFVEIEVDDRTRTVTLRLRHGNWGGKDALL